MAQNQDEALQEVNSIADRMLATHPLTMVSVSSQHSGIQSARLSMKKR